MGWSTVLKQRSTQRHRSGNDLRRTLMMDWKFIGWTYWAGKRVEPCGSSHNQIISTNVTSNGQWFTFHLSQRRTIETARGFLGFGASICTWTLKRRCEELSHQPQQDMRRRHDFVEEAVARLPATSLSDDVFSPSPSCELSCWDFRKNSDPVLWKEWLGAP